MGNHNQEEGGFPFVCPLGYKGEDAGTCPVCPIVFVLLLPHAAADAPSFSTIFCSHLVLSPPMASCRPKSAADKGKGSKEVAQPEPVPPLYGSEFSDDDGVQALCFLVGGLNNEWGWTELLLAGSQNREEGVVPTFVNFLAAGLVPPLLRLLPHGVGALPAAYVAPSSERGAGPGNLCPPMRGVRQGAAGAGTLLAFLLPSLELQG